MLLVNIVVLLFWPSPCLWDIHTYWSHMAGWVCEPKTCVTRVCPTATPQAARDIAGYTLFRKIHGKYTQWPAILHTRRTWRTCTGCARKDFRGLAASVDHPEPWSQWHERGKVRLSYLIYYTYLNGSLDGPEALVYIINCVHAGCYLTDYGT